MRIKVLTKDHFTLYEQEGKASLTNFLEAQMAQKQRSSAVGMVELLERVSKGPLGPKDLSTSLCHQIDKKEGIWELIKGRLRVLWFMDDGRVVFCTHGFLKKTQTTPQSEIDKAIRVKEKYLRAVENDSLEIVDDEEMGDS